MDTTVVWFIVALSAVLAGKVAHQIFYERRLSRLTLLAASSSRGHAQQSFIVLGAIVPSLNYGDPSQHEGLEYVGLRAYKGKAVVSMYRWHFPEEDL